MPDTVITVTDLRRQFSKIIKRVESGESFTVTRRGRPVCRLITARSVSDLAGSVKHEGAVRTLAEMEEAIAEGTIDSGT